MLICSKNSTIVKTFNLGHSISLRILKWESFVTIRGTHMFCTPLIDCILVYLTLFPKIIYGFLGFLGKILSDIIPEL